MIELQCRCGQVRLRHVGASLGHFVCYCRHCQASMAWLEAQGGTSSRSAGGGDQTLFVYSDDLEVLAGAELLALYSVVPRVRTPRVYASCCHTAIASTFTATALYTALKTVGVVDRSALPPVQEHINVGSAPVGGGPGDDGLPRYRGIGPLLGRALWGLRPWSGHRGVRWVSGEIQRLPSS